MEHIYSTMSSSSLCRSCHSTSLVGKGPLLGNVHVHARQLQLVIGSFW